MQGTVPGNEFGWQLSDPVRAWDLRDLERALAGSFGRQESWEGSPGRQQGNYFRVRVRWQEKQDHLPPEISKASGVGVSLRRLFERVGIFLSWM